MIEINEYNVLLLNPIVLNEGRSKSDAFQLGLTYLATHLKQNDIQVNIIAGENLKRETRDFLSDKILNSKYLIGFYVTADNYNEVELVSLEMKKLYKDQCKIIVGGPESSVSYSKILKSNNAIDFACIGAGEETILALHHCLSANLPLDNIPNLAYLGEGAIKTTNLTRPPKNLDSYSIPDRSLYDSRYIDPFLISSSRGCASKCTFCYEGRISNISHHSVERIVDEMKYLHETFNTRYFVISDDTFTTFPSRVLSFCQKFKQSFNLGHGFRWYCEGKVSDIDRNPNMLSEMVQSGLIRLQIGIESGNQEILKAYGKRITLEQIYNTAILSNEAGLTSLYGNFIIGGADETYETFLETLSLAMRLMELAPGIFECTHTFFSPYNGTDIKENPENYNLVIVDPEFYTGSSISKVFATPMGMTENNVYELASIFTTHVEQKMLSLIPDLPAVKIKRQLKAMAIELSTKWGILLLRDAIFSQWVKLYRMGYSDEPQDNVHAIPSRTFPFNSISNSSLTFLIRNKKFNFSYLEIEIIKYSSGKLTVGQIVNIIHSSDSFKSYSRDELTLNVFKFLNKLANELLILYRTDYCE